MSFRAVLQVKVNNQVNQGSCIHERPNANLSNESMPGFDLLRMAAPAFLLLATRISGR